LKKPKRKKEKKKRKLTRVEPLMLTFEWWLVKATVDAYGHIERVVEARAGGEDD
jgi:hypothetical protein